MTLTPTTRPSLLFRLRDSRDHAAWVEFVSLYEPVAYRLLRRHGLQDADARDVMQDLFMAVGRSIQRWDADRELGTFRGWLRRVALFHRAAERVREEVQPGTWQAFWETAVVGTPAADAAKKLKMEVGAVRVAKCRVLARLRVALNELEESP